MPRPRDLFTRTGGFPWHLWVALVVVVLLLPVANWLFPPKFQISHVQLASRGEISTVEFDATSHVWAPITKILRVAIFRKLRGPQPFLARRDISVALAPSETKRIHCEFPESGAAGANRVEVEILPDAQ